MPMGPSEQPQPRPSLPLALGAPKTFTFGGELQECGEQATPLPADGAASFHLAPQIAL